MSSFGRWILLAAMAIVAAACVGLGIWQMNRLTARQAANSAALRQRQDPEIDLNRVLPPHALANRRVAAAGEFDQTRQFLIRGRVYQGAPGIYVMTPLRRRGRDTAVLINRGFVPTPDAGPAGAMASVDEPTDAVVRGVALPIPDENDGAPLVTNRGESWGRLDLSRMRARVPYPLAPFYVVASEAADADPRTVGQRKLPIRIEPPRLDNGPHLAYAIQWFLIGVAALGFGLVYAMRPASGNRAPGA